MFSTCGKSARWQRVRIRVGGRRSPTRVFSPARNGPYCHMGRLSLKVVPGSSRDEIVGWLGDSLKVKVKAPPEKGRANEAVITLLADRVGIDASSIVVVSGHGSPAKVVAIDGMPNEAIRAAFPGETPAQNGVLVNHEYAIHW